MPLTDRNSYDVLKAQIIDNAHFLYPKKNRRPARPLHHIAAQRTGSRTLIPDSQDHHIESLTQSTQSRSSNSSSIASIGEYMHTFAAAKRDLNVAVARYDRDPDSQGSRLPEDVRYYALVYERGLCTGYADDEQEAQITREEHMLKCKVLTRWTPKDCRTEEEALYALLEWLQREVDRRCGSAPRLTRFDRRIKLDEDSRVSPCRTDSVIERSACAERPVPSLVETKLSRSNRSNASVSPTDTASQPVLEDQVTLPQRDPESTIVGPTQENAINQMSDFQRGPLDSVQRALSRHESASQSFETQKTEELPGDWKYNRRAWT